MMPAQQSDPFSAGGVFCANPHLYDYLHYLKFETDGTIEMNDGAGQMIFTVVKGRFSAESLGPAMFRVNFIELVELDPYYTHRHLRGVDLNDYIKAIQQGVPHEEIDVRSRPAPVSVTVTQEEGVFPIRKQVVWKINDESDWPYELYRVRYRFSADPLESFRPNRQGSLYFHIEAPETDTRLYYRAQDREERTARELTQEGISIDDAEL